MEKIYFKDGNDYLCYHIYTANNINTIKDILPNHFIEQDISKTIEVGPHNNFNSAFSSNIINILGRIGIQNVSKFEKVKLYDINDTFKYDNMLEKIYNNSPNVSRNYPEIVKLEELSSLDKYGLGFDSQEIEMYKNLYNKLNRNPKFIEIFDLCQSNSEHSRHWFFRGNLIVDDIKIDKSLFDMIKSTLNKDSNSVLSFCDNSSAIKGFTVQNLLFTTENNHIYNQTHDIDLVFTAETHNFPTLICPFEGAATGVGGRIRDNHATGRGAYLIAGTAGYCVGNIKNTKLDYGHYNSPMKILIDASNGASDYGNKLGEPIINGFTRSFGLDINNKRIEWIKPIMFTGGIGYIKREHLYKMMPAKNMLVIRIGGPAYKIGLGGGFSSSIEQDTKRADFEIAAVQRGDPQMENKLNRVIKTLIDNCDNNPIISIHDQGAGGLANVVKEIVYPNGAEINLNNITLGDNTLQPLEIWCSEFQESDVLIIEPHNLEYLKDICRRENIICDNIGTITNTGNIIVKYDNKIIIELPLEPILEPKIQKSYNLHTKNYLLQDAYYNKINIVNCIEMVLKSVDICSKRFLTNKVDRSVTGLIAQQQCVGPFHTPISNYCLVSISYFDNKGIASAIGERPILGLICPNAQGSMSVGEMITNMMGVYIGDISNIKCSGNWMWSLKAEGEGAKLFYTAQEICNTMKNLNIGIDGGKDSLSMSVKLEKQTINSPGNIVISGYASCPNIYKKVTPEFKKTDSSIIFIDFSNGNARLGGSVFLRQFNQIGNNPPTFQMQNKLRDCFNIVQQYILDDKILALHDKSDGGIITTLSEMCIASNIGADIQIYSQFSIYEELFNEELGVVIEINKEFIDEFRDSLIQKNIKFYTIGNTNNTNYLNCAVNKDKFNVSINDLSNYWEFTSFTLEKKQTNLKCANDEYIFHTYHTLEYFSLTEKLDLFCTKQYDKDFNLINNIRPTVGIIRDDGSNGDKEMCAVFYYTNFDVIDIHMTDLIKNPSIINKCRGIVFVGGFSHSDVLGAAEGWHITIKNNKNIYNEIQTFYKREDTFSLGVCNGCQLMIKLGVIDSNIKLVKNKSERFESRYSTVKIMSDKSIFFKHMQDMRFGIWVAHGEGQFINTNTLKSRQQTIKYTYDNEISEKYPFNPNGSENSLAGVCSYNGRHLAMMPHPERCFMKWQLPYLNNYKHIKTSPWLYMFKNIYDWCISN